jgi:nucleolar protein 15
MPKDQKQRAMPSASASEHESGSDAVQASAETHLRGFSPDEDSSDEDSSVDDKMDGDAVDIARLPAVARDDLSVKRRLVRAQKQRARILRSCLPDILIDFM